MYRGRLPAALVAVEQRLNRIVGGPGKGKAVSPSCGQGVIGHGQHSRTRGKGTHCLKSAWEPEQESDVAL